VPPCTHHKVHPVLYFNLCSVIRPHVAGGIALYLSAYPNATLQDVKDALFSSTNRSGLGYGAGTCGGIPETEFPNNSYGYGVLDIAAAISK